MEISNPSKVVGQNPFLALEELIKREDLKADVLVSCGDMGDAAQPEAINYTWSKTREMRSLLEADELVATAGNHDVDSRAKYTDFDARGTLLTLPEFPFALDELNNEYWSRNVVVNETEAVRWVVLNSAAYHGFEDEYAHGRIAATTLEYLKRRLSETSSNKLNVLVCHHHVYKIGTIDLDDYSEMTHGSALLAELEHGNHGSWLVLHGHRHWPSITYAPGANNSPVVFAAGSLSAVLWKEIAGKVRNQFYILELDRNPPMGRVRGTFTAWDFVSDEGFRPAQASSGLPHRGGFGGNLSGSELASRIFRLLDESGEKLIGWSEVVAAIAEVEFTLPADMEQCLRFLDEVHGLRVLFDKAGEPIQVGRP